VDQTISIRSTGRRRARLAPCHGSVTAFEAEKQQTAILRSDYSGTRERYHLCRGFLHQYARERARGHPPDVKQGDAAQRFSMHAFGAVFVEVAVDPDLGETRVRRIVGAYGAGRIVNPKTTRSHCIGDMIGGIGMALTEHDRDHGVGDQFSSHER
jgi:CO/xanthine dehydrogenase Mo-binding subunit